MRFAFVFLPLASLLLSGCASVAELRAGAHAERLAGIQNECQSNGASPGTSKYTRCVSERDRAENTRIQNERNAAAAAGRETARVYATESNDAKSPPTDLDCNFTKDGRYTCVEK